MTRPRIYSWNDFGSPGGIPTGSHLDKLKAIFKACLVDGYGDQPAAGWEMVHEHPNGFSITNGDGILNVVAGAHGHTDRRFGFYIAQEATDISEGLIQGTNLRSGAWIPDLYLYGPKHQLTDDIGWRKWVLIADNKSVTFYNAHGSAAAHNYYEHVLLLSFGEPKGTDFTGNFYCTGDTRYRYRQGSILSSTVDNLLSQYGCGAYPAGAGGDGGVRKAFENNNNIFLSPVHLSFNKQLIGYIPGVVVDSYYTAPAVSWRDVLYPLGLQDDFWISVGEKFDAGGHDLAYLYAHSQSYFITTDPRFW